MRQGRRVPPPVPPLPARPQERQREVVWNRLHRAPVRPTRVWPVPLLQAPGRALQRRRGRPTWPARVAGNSEP